jgi:hypothetical protein
MLMGALSLEPFYDMLRSAHNGCPLFIYRLGTVACGQGILLGDPYPSPSRWMGKRFHSVSTMKSHVTLLIPARYEMWV